MTLEMNAAYVKARRESVRRYRVSLWRNFVRAFGRRKAKQMMDVLVSDLPQPPGDQ